MSLPIITISESAGEAGFANVVDHLRGLAFAFTMTGGRRLNATVVRTFGDDDENVEINEWDELTQDYTNADFLRVDAISRMEYL